MNPQFSLFDLLILIGIIQGIITGVLLLNSKKNVGSNKYLALALFSFSLLTAKTPLNTLGLWDTHVFRFFPNALELAISPLIFFYVKSLVTPKFSFKPKYWLHFVPFFLSQAYAFVVYFSALKISDFDEKDSLANWLHFNDIKQLDEYLLLISLGVYLFYGYQELRNYKRWLDNTTSDGTYPDFGWLMGIFRLSAIIGVFLLVNHALDLIFDFKNTTLLHWNLLVLFFTFVIYYLGLKGYLQPDFSFNKKEYAAQKDTASIATGAEHSVTVGLLIKAMEEDRLFLDSKLNIYKLSEMLGVPQKHLSLVINQHFKMSFRDFINEYRVTEVKSMLNREDVKHMSILGIALECGFNSEATFYRIFKKSTGKSPREYKQQSI